jgi:hypothetical protein
MGRNWPAQIGNRGAVAMAHGRRRGQSILVIGGERGWGKWPRCTPAAQGSDFGRWRERKLTVEHAPWWRAVGRRGREWRASSGGCGDWLVAQREVRSIGGARSGVSRAVPWLEVPGDGGAPVDTAAALDTLPSATALSTRWSRLVLEEGVAPAAQLDWVLKVRWHGSSTAAARSRGTHSVWLEEQSDGRASGEEKNGFVSSMRTWPMFTDGARSASTVSCGHEGRRPMQPIRRCLQLTSGPALFRISNDFHSPKL